MISHQISHYDMVQKLIRCDMVDKAQKPDPNQGSRLLVNTLNVIYDPAVTLINKYMMYDHL